MHELTNEDKEKEKKWKKIYWIILIKACFLPMFIYAVVAVYLLGTPMEEWGFGLSKFNNTILEFLPQAQSWVNISVVYREKMILLFVVYSFCLFGSLAYMSFLVIKNRAFIFNAVERDEYAKPGIRFKFEFLRFFVFLMLLIPVHLGVTTQFESASDVFLIYEELDNSSTRSIFTDYVRWSTLRGILFHGIASIFLASLFWSILCQILVSWYCKSNFFERILGRIK